MKKVLLFIGTLMVAGLFLVTPAFTDSVTAQTPAPPVPGTANNPGTQATTGAAPSQAQNPPVPIDTDCEDPNGELNTDNCQIVAYLVNGINFLTAIAVMVIIFSIMWAGYEYMTAQDNSNQINSARMRIIWALVALGILIFTYAFLNWLVPGGVL